MPRLGRKEHSNLINGYPKVPERVSMHEHEHECEHTLDRAHTLCELRDAINDALVRHIGGLVELAWHPAGTGAGIVWHATIAPSGTLLTHVNCEDQLAAIRWATAFLARERGD